ncbi:hypothetical protein ACFFOU_26990 [Pseudonocardia sulfidoxydans]|uniref:hypothetical protein n=1 Tax=Pseudonocardia sulfidoxydans TaxID=54011 RepID=UPI0011BEC164|nr:hypothetical protein [Pseudonocardia sulfidoxydans]
MGVLHRGAENTVALDDGIEPSRGEAIDAASGALVVAASERGRHEYRLTVADTQIIVVPGLTEQGEVDRLDLHDATRPVCSHDLTAGG